VEVADLPLPEAQHAEACFDELNTAWETAAQEAKKAGQKPKLMKVGALPPHASMLRLACACSNSP
jgi:hypothetical protein